MPYFCPENVEILLAYAEELHFDDLSGFLRTAKSLRILRKKLAWKYGGALTNSIC